MGRLAPALAGLLVVVACSQPIDQTLDNTLWALETVGGRIVEAGSHASIAFAEGELGGTTGCNTIGGPFRVPGDGVISIGPLRSSLTPCSDDAAAARERAMMASLESAATYEILGSGLELRGSDGAVTSTYSPLVPDIEGSWQVIGYNTGLQAVRSVIVDSELSIEFGADGSVSGSSGCNTFSGDYSTDGVYTVVGGQRIDIGLLAITERACLEPDGVMEQEMQFQTALANSGLWRLVGDNLELRDPVGALQVSAVPAE